MSQNKKICIDFKLFKIEIEWLTDEEAKLTIKSSLAASNSSSYVLTYTFILIQNSFKFELRTPESIVLNNIYKAYGELSSLRDSVITSVNKNFYLRISQEMGIGSIEIFGQNTLTSIDTFSIEIQCKLHFSNGSKNDQIVYLNHLIPTQQLTLPPVK